MKNTTLSLLTFECNLAGIVNNEVNISENSSNDPFPTVVVPQDHTNLTTRVNEEDASFNRSSMIILRVIYIWVKIRMTLCVI